MIEVPPEQKSLRNWNKWIIATLFLSVIPLFIVQMEQIGLFSLILVNLIDFAVFLILLSELITGFCNAPYKLIHIQRNWGPLLFSLMYIAFFCYNKAISGPLTDVSTGMRVTASIQNILLILNVFSRYHRVATIIENLQNRPALTIVLSFLGVILSGTWLLMMPFTANSKPGLPLVDALFTATSAVCVTGLIVVDTATHFSVWGKIVLMSLFQIGGLGIMILSYFALFVLRRKLTVGQKNLMSYMLSEVDMSNLYRSLKTIIIITLIVESVGALILIFGFSPSQELWRERILLGVFHAVSAFCNAGFTLFSDNLIGYSSSPMVLMTTSVLIILGGLSFTVIANLKDTVFRGAKLALNSRIVLTGTLFLILLGMILIYPLELGGVLSELRLGEQYLSAFFQSVTLRTAGFNSIPFDTLSDAALVAMMAIMFIGGASGSTAGGIKVNTAAVLLATVRTAWKNDKEVVIRSQTVSAAAVNHAYLVLLFGVFTVIGGTFILSISEAAAIQDIVFEVVSAFATVGLSTGITASLSVFGKTMVIILMFLGRLGPLTLLSAASLRRQDLKITYPRANISIG